MIIELGELIVVHYILKLDAETIVEVLIKICNYGIYLGAL
jgi:hypothetical protein